MLPFFLSCGGYFPGSVLESLDDNSPAAQRDGRLDNSDLDDRESTQTCSAVPYETVPVCCVGCDLRDSVDPFSAHPKLSGCITSYFEGSSLRHLQIL